MAFFAPRGSVTFVYTEPVTRPFLLVCLLLSLPSLALSSDVGLSRSEGHPRGRFPLSVYLQPSGGASLDVAARKALADWNVLSRSVLGLTVFTEASSRDAAIVVTIEPGGFESLWVWSLSRMA